jgi:uncharacterized repeat protein (TIGR03803 family)
MKIRAIILSVLLPGVAGLPPLHAQSATLNTLYSLDGTKGNSPRGPLIFGPDGSLYGTTYAGGTNDNGGTVFRITPAGNFSSLASLSGGL